VDSVEHLSHVEERQYDPCLLCSNTVVTTVRQLDAAAAPECLPTTSASSHTEFSAGTFLEHKAMCSESTGLPLLHVPVRMPPLSLQSQQQPRSHLRNIGIGNSIMPKRSKIPARSLHGSAKVCYF